MSISASGRRAVSIVILVLLITLLALPSRASNSREQRAAQASRNVPKYQPLVPVRSGATQVESRDVEDNIPKHLPVAVHLRAEKERAAKDLKNEKWVRDFELEVKNTGDKPIYFIRFDLVPDLGKPPTERTPCAGLTVSGKE